MISLPFERILFIGAHPDDESIVAPLLGRFCSGLDPGAHCSFLVVTRGENGDCSLPGGCGDLGSLRAAEMQTAAAIFDASLIQWTYPDRMDDVSTAWHSGDAERDAMVNRIRAAVLSTQPTAVITFDPQHGSTCHPAHRELGRLVKDAVSRLEPAAPKLYLIETAATYDQGFYSFSNALSEGASVVDGQETWDYLIRDVTAHASQFTQAQLLSFRNTPIEQRRVYLISADRADAATYSFRCP